ncbi:hypothetical protein Tco_0710753 [Tanacetum coccineum]
MSNTNTNLQTQTSNALHNAIMEAGGKDRPPMLAPGIYNPPYKFKWTKKTVPVVEGSSENTTKRCMENYKNVSQDISNQLDAEAKVVQIILIGIDNDIYSTVDACPNACEMWKEIERLKLGESINVQDLETNLYWEFGKFTSRDGKSLESYYSRFVTLVNQSQELKIVFYHKLYDILKQHQNEFNELRAERLARTANPLALVAQQQQPVYHPQNHPNHYTQNSSTKSQPAATRNKGKAIVNSPPPTYDKEPTMVQNDNDKYNVFANDKEHPEQPEFVNDTHLEEQGDTNITINSLDMSTNGETDDQDDDDLANEHDFLASLIEKLKCEINDSKNRNTFLETSNKAFIDKLKGEIEDFKTKNKCLESSNNHFKKTNNELLKTNQLMFKDLKKFQAELDRYQDVNYASKFLNEIDQLSREYYYVDHMNAILGVYTTLDEFTDLQCDYVDQVVKCECLEKKLSKSNITSKSFEALQQHAIDLELALQQCQEQKKNDKAFKENQSKVFLKEREQYFEIQDLKAQLQDKGIAISELKKLIEKMKGKYVEIKFEKPLVIRQPNAFKSQRQSVLGKPATFSDSLAKTDFSKSKSIATNNVSNDFSKPVTA